jgi:hypothetical protein
MKLKDVKVSSSHLYRRLSCKRTVYRPQTILIYGSITPGATHAISGSQNHPVWTYLNRSGFHSWSLQPNSLRLQGMLLVSRMSPLVVVVAMMILLLLVDCLFCQSVPRITSWHYV